MITFPNGKSISTIVISTALGIAGTGIWQRMIHSGYPDLIMTTQFTRTTIIGKSMTRHRRTGNFRAWNPLTWKYIQNLGDDGMLNAYCLTNRGVEVHGREIAPAISGGVQVIPSFFPNFSNGRGPAAKEILEAVAILEERISPAGDFWAIEVSYSCPNVKECSIAGIVQDALWCTEQLKKNYPNLAVIAKISVAHPPKFAKMLSEAGADVIHSANTVPWNMLFDTQSPLEKAGGGGVSGGPAFQKVLNFNREVLSHYEGPIILGCGIVDDEKLLEYQRLVPGWGRNAAFPGQVSFSICTAALRRPKWVKEKIQDYNN